jgi:hypothetical protein
MWRTVLNSDVTVGGQAIFSVLQGLTSPTGVLTGNPNLRDFLRELFDAVWAFYQASPKNTLAFRDAADRVFEEAVSRIWAGLTTQNRSGDALEFVLWVLDVCKEWESEVPASPRYIHKGSPFYWAATSAFRSRNVDVAMTLLEAGDATDSEVYRRAGLLEAGVHFPGRATLTLDPNHANMLYNDVVAMRSIVSIWISDFDRKGSQPSGDKLVIGDLDKFLFKDPALQTAARYLIGHLLWSNIVAAHPVLGGSKGVGPLGRRRQAERLLGLLTATEGLVRSVSPAAGSYADALSALIGASSGGSSKSPKKLRKILDKITNGFSDDVEKCLDFWAKWSPSGRTSGFPWWVRWIEPGRFIRNQAAHILEAPPALETRWNELEETARYAFFSAIWLVKSLRCVSAPSQTQGTGSGPSAVANFAVPAPANAPN